MDNSLNNTKNLNNYSLDNKYLNSNMAENDSEPKVNYIQNVNIYGWGRNKNGELGLGKNALQSYSTPQPIKSLRNLNILQIASGGKHTAVLTSNGKLYVCGTHILGLLGIDNKEYKDFSVFQKLTTLDHEFIINVQCAEFHTLCLTNTGQVYAWGGSLHKKLGLAATGGLPQKVNGLINKKITQITCGDYHSCALTDNGELFSWGGGGISYNKGQCGHGDLKDYETPKRVEYFKNKRITKVVCGGYHTIALTDENKLYGFGKGNFGQCGYGEFEDTNLPKQVIFNKKFEMYENPFFDKKNLNTQTLVIKDIKCGGYHSVILSAMGKVYTFGHNMNGQLGLGDTRNHAQPEIVKSLLKKNITSISAGWSHTLILTDQGDFYACGSGKYGELGLDDSEYRKNFTLIKKVSNLNITNIITGGHHSWLMLDPLTPLKPDYHSPSPLVSNPASPRKSNTPSPKQHDVTIKSKFQDTSLQQTMIKTQQPRKEKMKLNMDFLADKYNGERVFLQVAYTDLKMSHRFIRFSLSPKYKDISNRDLNKKIADYLKKDNCVEFFRLQDDSEVLSFNNFSIASLYKDIKNSFKLLDVSKKINYSLCIVYDLNKIPQIFSLKSNLEGIKSKKAESKSIYDVMMLSRDDIISNDMEKVLSYWTLDFLEYFSDVVEENPKFLELRPNSFYI